MTCPDLEGLHNQGPDNCTMRIDGFQPYGPPALLRATPTTVTHTTGRAPVAARVTQHVEFETPSVPVQQGHLTMYTRAADRVEAAIQSALGGTLDVRA